MIVRKFGGASLSNPERIKIVAQFLARAHERGETQLIIVSAMGTTTNDLISLANQISSHPDHREMDMLISVGERISMSLMAMALRDLNVPAVSLTGSQAGVLTSPEFSNAQILHIRADRVRELLNKHQPVILAGFQGVCHESKEITTLGRGGSDLTAIAMAAALKAEVCEIQKDVSGILSADPKIVNNAQLIPQMSYSLLIEATFWGTKAVHDRAARLAEKYHVPIWVGPASSSNLEASQGTWIGKKETPMNINESATTIIVSQLSPVLIGTWNFNDLTEEDTLLISEENILYIYTNSSTRQKQLETAAKTPVVAKTVISLSWQGSLTNKKIWEIIEDLKRLSAQKDLKISRSSQTINVFTEDSEKEKILQFLHSQKHQ